MKELISVEAFIIDDDENKVSLLLKLKDTNQLIVLMDIAFNSGFNVIARGLFKEERTK